MLKRAVYTALFFAGIVLILVAATHSSSYQACQSEHQKHYADQKYPAFLEQADTILVCEGVTGDANGEFLTAIFTGALFISTVLLWSVTRKAADAAKQAAEIIPAIERPYVLIGNIRGEIYNPPANKALFPRVRVTFRNYGRTPANVEGTAIFARVLDHIPTDADGPNAAEIAQDGFDIDVTLGTDTPDRDWVAPFVDSMNAVESAQYLRLSNGQDWLFCWGWINYRDIFGQIHPTHFCRRYNFKRREFEPVGGMERNYSK